MASSSSSVQQQYHDTMASSSSSSVQQKHEVFISFRGEDTRYTFVSHLYEALRQKGIKTFIDNQLERGEEISPALLTAIEESTISVTVLSENYASSSWCLDELSKILDCMKRNKQIVIPIFYDVDPSYLRNIRMSPAEAFKKHQERLRPPLDEYKHHLRCQNETENTNLDTNLEAEITTNLPAETSRLEGGMSFVKAFAKHEARFKDSIDKVERWKAALVEVANLSGWPFWNDRPESEFICDIVKDIWVKLKGWSSSDDVVEGLVGMESRVKELEGLLKNMESSDGVRIIGIWGMPGVGKTTTAETLFKHICSQFDASYFLADVREKSASGALGCARNELFSEILKENIKIGTPSILGTRIPRGLRCRKVLIVLDDVDKSRQVEYLIGGRSCYCPGSTIIITSRDRHVLKGVKADIVYEVEKLTVDQALELFIHFAFRENQVHCIEGFMRLSIAMVRYADGIPLALKILGSFLCGKDEKKWESAIERCLSQQIFTYAFRKEIYTVLRISYDGLLDEHKKIFLDIACFFKGEDENHVSNILGGCGFSTEIGISDLVDKSLITISNNKLQMHDLVQKMGWEIVREESEHPHGRSRLWMCEDIIDVLIINRVTEFAVEGIFLNTSKIEEMCIMDPQAFENMSELRLLKIYNPHSQEDNNVGRLLEIYKPHSQEDNNVGQLDRLQFLSKLVYLHWHCYPLESLPLNFDPQNLVELHMHYSRVIQLWKGIQKLGKLKLIELSYSQCLKEMPDLSEAPNLERINLVGCTNLLEFPSTTRSLSKLKAVYLSSCSNLKKFPMLSRDVEELYLDGTAIEEVPSEIQYFSRLIKLNMKNCKRLKNLPSIHHKLESLEFLDLSGCSSLMNFPEISRNFKELLLNETAIKEVSSSIEFLGNVEKLYLGGTAIEQLPSTIECCIKLVLLDLKNCTRLKYLPTTICNLKSLEELNLSGCTEFASFPKILKTMEGLKNLYLDGTAIKELTESIEHLSGLSSLELENCRNLESLPNSITKMKFLENLNLSGCSKLVKLPDNLGRLKSLQVLKASGCKVQNSVGLLCPSLLCLSSLKTLHLSDCNLQYFPHNVMCMFSLEELDVSQNKFQRIPSDLRQNTAMEFLQLSYCESLRQLLGLPLDLMKLDAHGCTSLEEVSNMELSQSHSSNDEHFLFTNCFKLNQNARRNIEASALKRIQNLTSLVVSQLAIWSRDLDLRCYVAATNPTTMSLIGIRPCAVYCFPGDSIPEWFDHKTDGSSVNVDLPSLLVQFALCAVITFEDYSDDGDFKVRCEVGHQTYHLKGWSGQKGKPRSVTSDHVFMWYDSSITVEFDASNWSRKVSISFYPVDKDDNLLDSCKVKMCGFKFFSLFLETYLFEGQ